MTIAAAFLLAFISSAAGVYLFRRMASRSPLLLDIPNERSSHTRPVVRGAGLAIMLVVLAGYLIIAGLDANFVFVASAAGIATISFIDDLRSIPFLPRLAVHFIAAAALVYWSGGYTGLAIPFFGPSVEFGWIAGPVISLVFIAWMTNAFNFMDGTDGLAGVQGACAGLGWMLFGLVSGHPAIAALGAIIAGACLGFLLFNWQPASVFMGDVGSTFLGFTLASVPLFAGRPSSLATSEGLYLAAVFLWLFLFDTVFTRSSQVLRLRPFWRAHREHLYQRAVIAGASHRSVALFFGVIAALGAVLASVETWLARLSVVVLLVAGPIALLIFARKKRLT